MAEKIEITQDQIRLIQRLSGQGLNMEQVSAILGFSKDTIERRAKEMPELAAAIEKGRAEASDEVTKTAYRLAVSGKYPAMTMFWLKCRNRWKETSAVEHSGPDGKPIETKGTNELSDDELNSKIHALLNKSKGAEEG